VRKSIAVTFVCAALAVSARAAFVSCPTGNGSPTVTATVNGTSPVLLQLQFGIFANGNITSGPAVSRSGNTITVQTGFHVEPLQITPPLFCFTQTAAVSDLPPGTYTVNWTIVDDTTNPTYSTQFTVDQTIPPAPVPALGTWMLLALVVIIGAIGVSFR